LASNTAYTITSKCPFQGFQIEPVPKGFDKIGDVDKDAVAIACASCISIWADKVVFQEVHAMSSDRTKWILTFYGEDKKIPAQVITSIENSLGFLQAEVYVDSSISSKTQKNDYGEFYSSPLVISIQRQEYHQENLQKQHQQQRKQSQARKKIINMSNNFSTSSSSSSSTNLSTKHRPILSNTNHLNNISLHQHSNHNNNNNRSTISNVMGDVYNDDDDNSRFNFKKNSNLSSRGGGIQKNHRNSNTLKFNKVDIGDKRGFLRRFIDTALGVNYDKVVKQTINNQSQNSQNQF